MHEPSPSPLTPEPDPETVDSPDSAASHASGAPELDSRAHGLDAAGGEPASLIEAAHVTVEPDAKKRAERERSGFVEALVLVLIALVLALTLKTYVAEAYEIKGRSMMNTFLDGQRVVVLKSFYGIHRGDIIVFASTEESGKDLIKRVVGLPGERVKIERGQVFINGKKIQEDYIKADARELRDSTKEEVIKEGYYYVLGDNRPDSHDSRYFDAIPASAVKGKVVVRWWPFNQLKAF